MPDIARLETETRNSIQVSLKALKSLQDPMPCFIKSVEMTKEQKSPRANNRVGEHGSQIDISSSLDCLGKRNTNLKGRTRDISVDKKWIRSIKRFLAQDPEETFINLSLTEVTGPASGCERVGNAGHNNQISEGIDPKILQHVSDALQYMAGSQTVVNGTKEKSRSSDIDKNLAHTLEAIKQKHGDITQDCSLESDCMKTVVLLGICKVVQDLQKKQLKDLDTSRLDSYYTAVRDAANMKVNVQWLHRRLDEIKGAFNLTSESKSMVNERNRRLENIDRKKKELTLSKVELERLKSEVQDIEKQLALEVVMVEELNKKFNGQASKISKFQRTYLMDGLI